MLKSTKEIVFSVDHEAPDSLLPWLTYDHSLTERLQEKAGNTRLEVLRQSWQLPDIWDKKIFQITEQLVLQREIIMWASNEACWYARTTIPQTTYDAGKAIFDRLKNESLGALIFDEARIKRTSFTYYPVNTESTEYHCLNENIHLKAETLWTRCAVFTVDEVFPFYLIEILLPGILRYSN